MQGEKNAEVGKCGRIVTERNTSTRRSNIHQRYYAAF